MKFINSFALKIVLVGILALAMLIPLVMIGELVRERQNNADDTVRAISDEWSRAQTLAGPRLVFEYEVTEKDAAGKTQVRKITRKIYPEHLKVDADIATQLLHRSIYDVMVYRSDLALAGDFVIPEDCREDREKRAEALLNMFDWDANIDPDFREKFYHEPIPVKNMEDMIADGYIERWVSYGSKDFAAKELRVLPGRTGTIKDDAAYGFIMMQGYGTINGMEINTPVIIRVGQPTADEGFVIRGAAEKGVVIENKSEFSEIVMLKHFNGDSKAALAMVQKEGEE